MNRAAFEGAVGGFVVRIAAAYSARSATNRIRNAAPLRPVARTGPKRAFRGRICAVPQPAQSPEPSRPDPHSRQREQKSSKNRRQPILAQPGTRQPCCLIPPGGQPSGEMPASCAVGLPPTSRHGVIMRRTSTNSAAPGTIGELLDDLVNNTARAETAKVRRYVIEANIRPFFGKIKAKRLTTATIEHYRERRLKDGISDATANRELALVRTALYMARKRTPPKVLNVPYFPMKPETTIRQGFLEDAQYVKLRDELPPELRPLFVVAYGTGVRRGELLRTRWEQVDFESEEIVLRKGETKTDDARVLPFLTEDMTTYLKAAKKDRDENFPQCPWVFSRRGEPIRDFRLAWDEACKRAGVPDLLFHDLRRTADRNMRRAGIPQVIRMKITGHKTDSMERRYSIVDTEDFQDAKSKMRARGIKPVTDAPESLQSA